MDKFKLYAVQRIVLGVLFTVIALWAISFVLGLFNKPTASEAAREAGKATAGHESKEVTSTARADTRAVQQTSSPRSVSSHGAPAKRDDLAVRETTSSHGDTASERAEEHPPAPFAEHGALILPSRSAEPPGVAFVKATVKPMDYELNERWWGWRPNDIINFTDNVNNYQLGVLEVTRRTAVILAERISRTGVSDAFNKNLENAMNWFMVKPDRYWFPSPESKYDAGLDELRTYMEMLKQGKASFYTRTDNLIPLLQVFEDLMGSCEENLVKTNEKGGDEVSHFMADDYFFYAQGVASAMGTILEAVAVDFEKIMEARRGRDLLLDIIGACHHALEIDPIYITNASLSGILANHRANMAAPISHARFSLGVLIKTLST